MFIIVIIINAEFLTKDHHKSKTSWDEMSPYYRLKEEIHYYSLLFPSKVEYEYKDINGNMGKHSYLKRVGDIDTRKISKYFDKKELIEFQISNLEIYTIRANILISRAIELGRKGVTMYVKPEPLVGLFGKIQSK